MPKGNPLNLKGQRFGRLIAIESVHKKRIRAWRCQCDCGRERIIPTGALRSGNSTSCGCKRNDTNKIRGHGRNKTIEHRRWVAMRQRCSPNNPDRRQYYKRGIRICKRWNSFMKFFQDMGKCPSPKHSLERRNNAGDYKPSNCYWATATQQARNKRNTRWLTYKGETVSLQEWGERLGIEAGIIKARLRLGWSIHRAMTEAPRRRSGAGPQTRRGDETCT